MLGWISHFSVTWSSKFCENLRNGLEQEDSKLCVALGNGCPELLTEWGEDTQPFPCPFTVLTWSPDRENMPINQRVAATCLSCMEVRIQLRGVGSVLPLCELWTLNSGHKAWQQASLAAELAHIWLLKPSCWKHPATPGFTTHPQKPDCFFTPSSQIHSSHPYCSDSFYASSKTRASCHLPEATLGTLLVRHALGTSCR